MVDVRDVLKVHKQIVESKFPDNKILFMGIFGSQNYGLATPDSDVDSCFILRPSINEYALNKMFFSSELNVRNELARHEWASVADANLIGKDHIIVRDLFTFLDYLKDGEAQELEIVCSDYFKSFVNSFSSPDKLELFNEVITPYFYRTMHFIDEWNRQEHSWNLRDRNTFRRLVVQCKALEKMLLALNSGKVISNPFFLECEDAAFLMRVRNGECSLEEAQQVFAPSRAKYEDLWHAISFKTHSTRFTTDANILKYKVFRDLLKENAYVPPTESRR